MCKGMNRSFVSVILGGFGGEVAGPAGGAEQKPVKQGSAEDAAFVMKNASKIIIVPGYGMAVLEVWKAGTVMFSKRSLASGYAGIDNTLFYRDNTMMLFGDAKKMTESIAKEM